MNDFQTHRSPDYLYVLSSEPTYGWRTGRLKDGRQLLIGRFTFFFSSAGDFLSRDSTPEGGFTEAPIHVKRFLLVERHFGAVGLRDLPETAREFAEGIGAWGDDERQEYPELIREWFESGKYVFHFGSSDFYLNANGHVETS